MEAAKNCLRGLCLLRSVLVVVQAGAGIGHILLRTTGLGGSALTGDLAEDQRLQQTVAGHVIRTGAGGEALGHTASRVEALNNLVVLGQHVSRNVGHQAALGMTQVSSHVDGVEGSLERVGKKRTVELVLALLDFLAIFFLISYNLVF